MRTCNPQRGTAMKQLKIVLLIWLITDKWWLSGKSCGSTIKLLNLEKKIKHTDTDTHTHTHTRAWTQQTDASWLKKTLSCWILWPLPVHSHHSLEYFSFEIKRVYINKQNKTHFKMRGQAATIVTTMRAWTSAELKMWWPISSGSSGSSGIVCKVSSH